MLRVVRRLATAAATGTEMLRVTLALPHRTVLRDAPARQVDLPTSVGAVGVLAGHTPSVFEVRPGVVRVFGAATKDGGGTSTHDSAFFVSGGFATVEGDRLQVAAMEGAELERLDAAAIDKALRETEARGPGTTDAERAEIEIHREVYAALSAAVSSLPKRSAAAA